MQYWASEQGVNAKGHTKKGDSMKERSLWKSNHGLDSIPATTRMTTGAAILGALAKLFVSRAGWS